MPRQTESTVSKLLTIAKDLTTDELVMAIDIFKHTVKENRRYYDGSPDRSKASASRTESPKGRGRRRATSQTDTTVPAVVGE